MTNHNRKRHLNRDYTKAPGIIRLGVRGARGIVRDHQLWVIDDNGFLYTIEEALDSHAIPTPAEIAERAAECRAKRLEEGTYHFGGAKDWRGRSSEAPGGLRTVRDPVTGRKWLGSGE